jgi:peptidoglycan L-alanyl-D-glutamate endopeptidase CwlK
MFVLGKRSRERLQGIDSDLIEVVELALTISKIDFGIPEFGGLRTEEDQRGLYTAGASKCDGIVNKSYHQTGRAFDIYAYVDGKASWDKHHLTACAAAILQAAIILGVPLEWGGNWKTFVDMPHFQKPEV